MSETKWTPGAWVYDPDFEPENEPVIWTAGDIADAVAYLSTSAPNSDEEIVANAHLIAAAPELYAALSYLLEIALEEDGCAACAFNDGDGNDPCAVHATTRDANRALARARGEVTP